MSPPGVSMFEAGVPVVERDSASVNRVARSTGEAAVIVGDKAAQHGIGGIEIASTGQAQFTALQHAPKALAPQ